MASLLRKVDYVGYVLLEFAGQGDAAVEVPKSLALLRQAFASA